MFNASAIVTALVNGDTVASHNFNGLTNGATLTGTVTASNITITIIRSSINFLFLFFFLEFNPIIIIRLYGSGTDEQ